VSNPDEIATLDKRWLNLAIATEVKEAQRRRTLFLQGRHPVSVKDKIAIIVDDGLATGLTMLAAVHEIRKRWPARVVVAVPVAAAETAKQLRSEVDDLVVLTVPAGPFEAIGAFYQYFDQVGDEEVITLMRSVNPVDAG
jgi:predicted phosphoribosyltransferase